MIEYYKDKKVTERFEVTFRKDFEKNEIIFSSSLHAPPETKKARRFYSAGNQIGYI